MDHRMAQTTVFTQDPCGLGLPEILTGAHVLATAFAL